MCWSLSATSRITRPFGNPIVAEPLGAAAVPEELPGAHLQFISSDKSKFATVLKNFDHSVGCLGAPLGRTTYDPTASSSAGADRKEDSGCPMSADEASRELMQICVERNKYIRSRRATECLTPEGNLKNLEPAIYAKRDRMLQEARIRWSVSCYRCSGLLDGAPHITEILGGG